MDCGMAQVRERRGLLISTYEMGRQPFGLASAAAWLRNAGFDVECADVAKQRLRPDALNEVDLIGFHLPMHTATRLAGPIAIRARRENPGARICAFGLYAPLNEAWLRSIGVDAVFGGEFEEELTAWATEASPVARPFQGRERGAESPALQQPVPGIHFLVPDRAGLPPLARYASLQLPDGSRRLVAYTEASRGCKHVCRHCPVVPIYNGQFRVVAPDVVLADIDAQIRAGAQHVTFGDP